MTTAEQQEDAVSAEERTMPHAMTTEEQLQQTQEELKVTQRKFDSLQQTLLYELQQKYVYRAMDTDEYVELDRQRRELLSKDSMTDKDRRGLQTVIDKQITLMVHSVFAGAYEDFHNLFDTMQECSYIGSLLETLMKNPTMFDLHMEFADWELGIGRE